jgi:hypothetical protein
MASVNARSIAEKLSTQRSRRTQSENPRNRAGLGDIQEGLRLSAAGVHFEMRILAQLFDADEHAAMPCSRAQFGATVASPSPA